MFKKLAFILLIFWGFLVNGLVVPVYARNDELCNDNSPIGKPILSSAIARKNTVTLTWTEAGDPLTHYQLAYGRSESKVEFGSPNIGGKGVTTYTVGSLEQGVKYYFKIRAANGCRPGDFSNKLSAIPGVVVGSKKTHKIPNLSIYKSVLAASTSEVQTAKEELESPPVATQSVTSTKCLSCNGWPPLAVEAISVFLYLFFARKLKFLKPIFSFIIPAIIYIWFIRVFNNCSMSNFSCKYFVPLEAVIFILTVILHKDFISRFKKKTLD